MKETLYSKEKKIKVSPSENCICNSGKSYKECCMKKNIEYKTLGKNYRNEEIVFNYTETSAEYDNISNCLLKDIIDKDLSVSKGKEYLKYLYKIAYKGGKQFTKYSPCKKGCSHCCNIYMDCTAVEAELIREYVISNFKEEEIENFKKVIGNTINDVPTYKDVLYLDNNNSVELYSKKHIPCIFLSKENTCLIYEVRPLNCRKFITFSDSINCERGENVVKPNISVNNIAQYSISYLSMNIVRFKRLKVYSEINLEEKAIYKALHYWFKNGFHEISRDL